MTTIPITANAANPTLKQLRVLYADDMRELRDLIVIVLGRDGHSVDTVPNGEMALEKISADPTAYDLVITDHHMPGINGLELVSSIRTKPYQGKIIVFSSELSDTVESAYRRLKVDHLLPKPIFPSQLRAIVATL
jgi:two-component system chemotaxis response regulator CheY